MTMFLLLDGGLGMKDIVGFVELMQSLPVSSFNFTSVSNGSGTM